MANLKEKYVKAMLSSYWLIASNMMVTGRMIKEMAKVFVTSINSSIMMEIGLMIIKMDMENMLNN